MASLTEEEENFLRIFKLINGIASKAVRKKFDQCFPPATLVSFLQANEQKIRQSPFLKGHQISKLFPNSGIRSSSSFDIILMITMIRNFSPGSVQKPLNGFDKLPLPTELFEGAYLAIVKYYRNEIAHSQKDTLTNSEFQKMWTDLSEASIGLGGASFKTECDQLFNSNLDNDIIVNLRQEFQEMREDMEHKLTDEINRVQELAVRCSCHDFHQIEIADWEKQNIKFVAIDAKDAVLQYIKDVRRATVTGIPGSGKSALIQHIALSLRDQEGYSLIPCSKPSEIINHYSKDRCQVFVVNDSCGRSVLNQYDAVEWKKHTSAILNIIEKGNTILLSSCRSQVFQESSFKTLDLFSCHFCDLSAGVFELSVDKKIEIAKKYMAPEIVANINEELKTCKMVPLLCSCYERDPKSDVKLFFQNPVLVYNDKLDELAAEFDRTKFCSLFLSILYNGSIPKDSIKCLSRKQLEEIFEIFGVNRGTCTTTIIEQLDSLSGTFLVKSDGGYSMIHDKLFDILCAYFGNHYQQSLIRFAHSKVIYERTLFRHANTKDCAEIDDLTIFLESCYEDDYFRRILDDLSIGNIIEVFYSQQMENAEFRRRLICFMQTQDQPAIKSLLNIRDKVQKGGVDTAFHIVCALGYEDFFRFFLNFTENVNIFASDEFPPMHQACYHGNHSIVELFIKKGADINCSTEYGLTPLMWACIGEQLHIVELLLKNRADVNQCVAGRRAIFEACSIQSSEILETLIRFGSKINVTNFDRETPISLSAKNRLDRHVKILLSHCTDNQLQTVLLTACKTGFLELVRLLIQRGVDLNHVDQNGITGMAYACEYGHLTIVKTLIGEGCNLASFDDNGVLLLEAACRGQHKDIVEYLIQNNVNVNSSSDSGWTALMGACVIGDVGLMTLLLDNGASINQSDDFGRSPLMLVSQLGNTIAVHDFITRGANINQKDELGWTAFLLACENKRIEVIKILNTKVDISHILEEIEGQMVALNFFNAEYIEISDLLIKLGLDINLKNTCKHTILIEAIYFNNAFAVKFLLKNGANPNVLDDCGQTPLLIACIKRSFRMIPILVKKGADVNQCDKLGNTALHKLCSRHMTSDKRVMDDDQRCLLEVEHSNDVSAVKYLLSKGLEINVKDNEGQTPLLVACINRNHHFAQCLIKEGADVNISNDAGETALLICCNADQDFVETLVKSGAYVNQCDLEGTTPLMIACKQLQIDVVDILLTKGAEVNITDYMKKESAVDKLYAGQLFIKQTPKQITELDKRKTIARKLLTNGMTKTFEIESKDGPVRKMITKDVEWRHMFSSLDELDCFVRCILTHNRRDLITEFFFHDAFTFYSSALGTSPFFEFIRLGYSSLAIYLIETGTDINEVNYSGLTPLITSIQIENIVVTEYLIKKGVDVNRSDQEGRTPLRWAVLINNCKLVEVLINSGVVVNEGSRNGRTVLMWTYRTANIPMARLLLDKGADVSLQDAYGINAIFWALFYKISLSNSKLFNMNDDNRYVSELQHADEKAPYPDRHEMEIQFFNDQLSTVNEITHECMPNPIFVHIINIYEMVNTCSLQDMAAAVILFLKEGGWDYLTKCKDDEFNLCLDCLFRQENVLQSRQIGFLPYIFTVANQTKLPCTFDAVRELVAKRTDKMEFYMFFDGLKLSL